ncbi:hypothetical protein EVAR_26712_1 [Eumeta japonica]|uniref:Uncharacterized protein n=1 Tax=Eumeta variegata TaxID=151549 RepID=A0A4C1ZTI6_EUMVA|nr:hypothetical protein EVAR_26712_1 [Eumeta japonica]
MSDFQGLMMEPEGSDDGASNFQLRYQTLKANHGQSVFHENINKSKQATALTKPSSNETYRGVNGWCAPERSSSHLAGWPVAA